MKKPKNLKDVFPRIGLWATVWWAVSGLYLVLIVWLAREYFADNPEAEFTIANWKTAIGQAFETNTWLFAVGLAIILVWVVGGYLWIKALKKHKISLKAGLKDLIGTLRK